MQGLEETIRCIKAIWKFTSRPFSTLPLYRARPRQRAAAVRLANNADNWSALATTSFFVTDSWSVNRLTMNLGAARSTDTDEIAPR